MTKPHDSAYRLLFSEPQMVVDLLQGFVHEDWVKELDFNTLETVSGSYITDDLRSREDDVIWRVKYQQGWIYIYLLIEFQSSVDKYMAVRLMTYVGLLYQDLIKLKRLTPKQQLPPVYPIVLYNGDKRWTAATELRDLIVKVPGDLEKYLPSLSYLLLDEKAYKTEELAPLKNLVAAIFRLENPSSNEEIIDVINNLVEWLATPEQARLKRSFIVWIKRMVLTSYDLEQPIENIHDLLEIRTMLAERIAGWKLEWAQQARQQARIDVMKDVMEQGIEKSMKDWMEQGLLREKSLLFRQIQRRFDKVTSESAQAFINSVFDTEILELIGDAIIDCPDAGSFLAQLKDFETECLAIDKVMKIKNKTEH